MAIVGQFAWVSRLTSGVPLGAWLGARGFALAGEAAKRARNQIKGACRPASLIRPICSLRKSCILSEPRSSLTKSIIERFVAVVRSKNASPTWSDVRTALLDFDRAGLRGLVQDLYAASEDNQAFLHARLGLGHDQLKPFKPRISRWIFPDLINSQPL